MTNIPSRPTIELEPIFVPTDVEALPKDDLLQRFRQANLLAVVALNDCANDPNAFDFLMACDLAEEFGRELSTRAMPPTFFGRRSNA